MKSRVNWLVVMSNPLDENFEINFLMKKHDIKYLD